MFLVILFLYIFNNVFIFRGQQSKFGNFNCRLSKAFLMDLHNLFIANPVPDPGNAAENVSADSSPSTSRANSLKLPPSHKCITLWDPIVLKQEWTVSCLYIYF